LPRASPRGGCSRAPRWSARALGFGDDFGSIEAGKRAAMIAIPIPAGVDDVEEYLVGGVEPADIQWLDPQS
jgi:cytosine/adenosine deaminase-related metal-dependent hydrolase